MGGGTEEAEEGVDVCEDEAVDKGDGRGGGCGGWHVGGGGGGGGR